MITITESILIAEPPEDVFAFACDYRNDPLWRSGVTEMRLEPEGETRVGSRTHETLTFMGRRLHTTAEVVHYELGKGVAFRSLGGPVPVSGSRSVTVSPEGTRFTYHLTAELEGAQRLFGPLMAWVFWRQLRADLKTLRWQLGGWQSHKRR